MQLIDTHTHLYLDAFETDRKEIVDKAMAAGVKKLFLPNVDKETIAGMMEMEKQWPDVCFPMMGVHPCSIKEDFESELKIAREWLEKRPFTAVGEIGIDLHWDKSFFEQQKIAFLRQIDWALEFDVPIVIHSREATDIIISLLQNIKGERPKGIFHCFTGNLEQAKAIIDLGFYLGIGGVLTFKNAGLDKTVTNIDLKHLVLETDSPYLTPTPYRGKRNESSYIKLIAEKLASVKEVQIEEVAEITTNNAKMIFKNAF